MNSRQLNCHHTFAILLVAALVLAALQVHMCDASYSCCSEERRGTVCTLAGSGNGGISIDSPNPTAAAISGPVGVALYPPDRIIVGGHDEGRLRVIHHNGTVSTLAGGSSGSSYVDSDAKKNPAVRHGCRHTTSRKVGVRKAFPCVKKKIKRKRKIKRNG